MSDTIDTRPTILKFFNEHLIRISKLNIKAFYGYHACAHKCYVKDPANKHVKHCLQTCNKQLDQYFTYSEAHRPYNKGIFSIEGYQTTKQTDQYQYRRDSVTLSETVNEYADSLDQKLDAWIGRQK